MRKYSPRLSTREKVERNSKWNHAGRKQRNQTSKCRNSFSAINHETSKDVYLFCFNLKLYEQKQMIADECEDPWNRLPLKVLVEFTSSRTLNPKGKLIFDNYLSGIRALVCLKNTHYSLPTGFLPQLCYRNRTRLCCSCQIFVLLFKVFSTCPQESTHGIYSSWSQAGVF